MDDGFHEYAHKSLHSVAHSPAFAKVYVYSQYETAGLIIRHQQ